MTNLHLLQHVEAAQDISGAEEGAHHYREDEPNRKGFRSGSPYHANGCGQPNHLRRTQSL